jgi:hypothetical protein
LSAVGWVLLCVRGAHSSRLSVIIPYMSDASSSSELGESGGGLSEAGTRAGLGVVWLDLLTTAGLLCDGPLGRGRGLDVEVGTPSLPLPPPSSSLVSLEEEESLSTTRSLAEGVRARPVRRVPGGDSAGEEPPATMLCIPHGALRCCFADLCRCWGVWGSRAEGEGSAGAAWGGVAGVGREDEECLGVTAVTACGAAAAVGWREELEEDSAV